MIVYLRDSEGSVHQKLQVAIKTQWEIFTEEVLSF